MWNWKVCSNLFKFEQNIACHGSDSKDLMKRKNASGFQRRIHKTIASKSTRSKWIIVCIVIGIMLLHLKALGGRRVVKEHTKKVPVCLLHLKDFGCAVELSKMDPRTTLLKRADSFEDGLNCGRIRFEKELNRIYFTAQHIWCFTAWINEVNVSTLYQHYFSRLPWIIWQLSRWTNPTTSGPSQKWSNGDIDVEPANPQWFVMSDHRLTGRARIVRRWCDEAFVSNSTFGGSMCSATFI